MTMAPRRPSSSQIATFCPCSHVSLPSFPPSFYLFLFISRSNTQGRQSATVNEDPKTESPPSGIRTIGVQVLRYGINGPIYWFLAALAFFRRARFRISFWRSVDEREAREGTDGRKVDKGDGEVSHGSKQIDPSASKLESTLLQDLKKNDAGKIRSAAPKGQKAGRTKDIVGIA